VNSTAAHFLPRGGPRVRRAKGLDRALATTGPRATLYTVPGCPYSTIARLMLAYKRIPYRRIDLIQGPHGVVLRRLGFPERTAPALKIGSRRVHSTLGAARALDDALPERPLLALEDPVLRLEVEETTAWARAELGPLKEYLFWWAIERNPSAAGEMFADARMGVPRPLVRRVLVPAGFRLMFRAYPPDVDAALQCVAAVPSMLDRVEGLIARGVLGGEHPNAADFHAGLLIRLLMCLDDLRPAIAERPAGRHAMRVCPVLPPRLGRFLEPDQLDLIEAPTGPADSAMPAGRSCGIRRSA
jgi:glutathione S-transferase